MRTDHLFENTQLTSNFLINAENIEDIREKVATIIGKRAHQSSTVNSFNSKYFKETPSIYRAPQDIPPKALTILDDLYSIPHFNRALDRTRFKSDKIPNNINVYLTIGTVYHLHLKRILLFSNQARIYEFLYDQRSEEDYALFSRKAKYEGYEHAVLANLLSKTK